MESKGEPRGGKIPVFWYPEFWMHSLYSEGILLHLRLKEVEPPFRYMDDSGARRDRGDCRLFYWSTINSIGELSQPESPDTVGLRLFVRKNDDGEDYYPVVEIRHIKHTNEMRMYACRDFNFGDAVMFVPEFEEKSGTFVLGGHYARMVYQEEDVNVYLTTNRVLRCVKDIQKGEEIIRGAQEIDITKYLEHVDQVVVSLDNMMIGRVLPDFLSLGSGRLVRYPNGYVEVILKTRHKLVFESAFPFPL